jgi:hypothetical protein
MNYKAEFQTIFFTCISRASAAVAKHPTRIGGFDKRGVEEAAGRGAY